MDFSGVSVRKQLMIGFGLLIAVMLFVSGLAVSNLTSLGSQLSLIVDNRIPKMVSTNEITYQVNIIARTARNMLLMNDEGKIRQEYERILKARVAIDKELSYLKESITSNKGKELIADLLQSLSVYRSGTNKLIEMIQAGRKSEATEFMLGDYRVAQSK